MTSSKYNKTIADDICVDVVGGLTVRELCKKHEIDPHTLYRWLAKYDDFRRLYNASREIRTDMDIDDLVQTVKGCPVEIAAINKARLIADTMKWVACKRVPSRYGDNPVPFESRERPGIRIVRDTA